MSHPCRRNEKAWENGAKSNGVGQRTKDKRRPGATSWPLHLWGPVARYHVTSRVFGVQDFLLPSFLLRCLSFSCCVQILKIFTSSNVLSYEHGAACEGSISWKSYPLSHSCPLLPLCIRSSWEGGILHDARFLRWNTKALDTWYSHLSRSSWTKLY